MPENSSSPSFATRGRRVYKNGKIKGTLSKKAGEDLKTELKMAVTCFTYTITTYYEQCTDWFRDWNGDGKLTWDEYTNTTCKTYSVTSDYTECLPYFTGSGGGYIPPVEQPQPCTCTKTCPVCGGCLDEALLKSANAGCPPCSCPGVFTDNLSKYPKADCIYSKLIKGSVLNGLINRYFGLSLPVHSYLGELDLYWDIQNLDSYGINILGLTHQIGSPSNPGYGVKITIDTDHLNNDGISSIAYTMLHEAVHAKLIASYYDKTGTTDFKTLFIEDKKLYGAEAQHFEMYLNEYITQLAQGVKDFDLLSGINRDLIFYQRAISFQLRNQLKLNSGNEGATEYYQLSNSGKVCKR